jgi:hypothetical protein
MARPTRQKKFFLIGSIASKLDIFLIFFFACHTKKE